MTAKEFLNEPLLLYRRARRLEERYRELFERATSPRCALNIGDGLGVQSTPSGNTRERLLVELADAKQEYIAAELDYIECRQDTFDILVDIDGTVGDILIARYIKLLTWEEVSKDKNVSISESMTHRLHRKGLRIVEEKLAEKGNSEYQHTPEQGADRQAAHDI